jgi:ribonuclease BN (tRNA processing enzyme)
VRVTVVGSGTLLPDAERRSAAHHLQATRASVLLDCGSGALHGLAACGIDWRGLTHVAITHYHADHVGDLAPLLFALRNGLRGERTEPLVLLGPPGFGAFVERLAAAMGTYVMEPGFPLDVVEIQPGVGYADPARNLRIDACPTPHTDASMAYRVQVDGEVVGYTGDTGPSDEVAAFLEGCGLLIAECAWPDPCEGEGHLSPERVAALAARARPGLLALTHVYPPMTAAEAAAQVAARHPGSVVAADDGMRFVPGPAGWAVDHRPSAM